MKTHSYLEDIVAICDMKHLSAQEIFTQLQKKYSSVAQASVYRNIQKLVADGQLTELRALSKKETLYEKTISPHLHLVDVDTGNVVDAPFDPSVLVHVLPSGMSMVSSDITIFVRSE